jgi:hypothetical protein
MVPTITSPITQFAGSTLLAVLLLCLSTAILRADESRSASAVEVGPKHCRIYFGCLPAFAKQGSRLN